MTATYGEICMRKQHEGTFQSYGSMFIFTFFFLEGWGMCNGSNPEPFTGQASALVLNYTQCPYIDFLDLDGSCKVMYMYMHSSSSVFQLCVLYYMKIIVPKGRKKRDTKRYRVFRTELIPEWSENILSCSSSLVNVNMCFCDMSCRCSKNNGIITVQIVDMLKKPFHLMHNFLPQPSFSTLSLVFTHLVQAMQ